MSGVRVRAAVAVGIVAGLVASVLVVVPAQAGPLVPAAPLPSEVAELPADQGEALAAARQRGERVEVLTERTEFSQTFATPRGTFVVEEHVRPQWVRSAAGVWVPADPSLRPGEDGVLRPVAATAAMRFSGGGALEPLASIRAGGVSVGLRWPGPLPEPVVDGNVATYRDVLPLVDLRVVADVDGFTHLVVIRSPKALDDPKVREIVLGIELSGGSLRVAETGAVEAVDGSGEVVLAGPSPMMWDSRDVAGGGGDPPGDKGAPGLAPDAGVPADVQPAMAAVAASVSPGMLRLVPDLGFLHDPDTVYPVFVDPTWVKVTGKRNSWSLLRKSFPGSAFFNPPVGSTSPSDATKGIVRAGFVVEDRTYTDRSVFNMSTTAVRYKRINKATFSLTQGWSYYNCTSATKPVTELRAVGSFGSSTTWNSQPSWGGLLATSNQIRKYGYSGCSQRRVEYNVTNHIRSRAASGNRVVWLGLRARSESTGNWTRFRIDAVLTIEYNSAPNAPGSVKVTGKAWRLGRRGRS